MLIYVQNKAFPHRTFVLSSKAQDKVARLRAQLLHILYDIGKENHEFRLKYKDEILRDADYLGDYGINDNSVITMSPLNKTVNGTGYFESPSFTDKQPLHRGTAGHPPNIQDALGQEIKSFDQREKYLNDFKALLYIHSLVVLLTFLTVYWYSVAWTGVLFTLAVIFVPTYTRVGGFVGNYTHWRKYYCVGFGVGAMICLAVLLYFAVTIWTSIVNHGCKDWMFVDDCSHRQVFSALLYTIHSLLLIISCVVVWILLVNFRIEIGDFIEKYLVQERDIEKVVLAAKNGRMKEKRQAAYELATLAATSDENRLLIAAEGGLQVLESLTLSQDSATQEHALEALSELLVISSIQDTFIRSGSCSSLLAALNSPHPRSVMEAANALYTIVSESEENKHWLIKGHGVEDLAHAAYEGTVSCRRIIGSIFLELVFNTEIRAQLAQTNTTVEALTYLCERNDLETKRYALQALELMAIENSELICAQENLIDILLNIPFKTMDDKLYLLAGKILMYYAETTETCEQLLDNGNIKESLGLFARSDNPILQKVVVKIIFSMLETNDLKSRAVGVKLDKVLEYIRDHPADREAWDMADQGLNVITSSDDLYSLPTLTTLEKLKKMETTDGFGSSSSIGPPSFSSSSLDLKKETA